MDNEYRCTRDGCDAVFTAARSLQTHIDVRHGPPMPEDDDRGDPVATPTPRSGQDHGGA